MDEMAREINNSPKLSKAYDDAKVAELKEMAEQPKAKEGSTKGGEKTVDPTASQKPKKAGEGPEMGRIRDQEARAVRIFKKVVDGAEPEIDAENLLKGMEQFPDAESLIRHVYDEAEDIMKAERKTQTHKQTEALATQLREQGVRDAKKLGNLTGNDPDGILNQMRNMYGDIKGATQKARMMFRTLTTYGIEVDKMITNWDGSTEQMLEIIERLKHIQEIEVMCVGVRAESGRLLNINNMKQSELRFDFSEFNKMKDLPDYVTKNKRKFEDIIKAYGDKATIEEKLKFTRFLGHGGLMQWVLSFRQAALLWSPVTHVVNTTSQTGAVMFRLVAKTFANSAMSVQKMDSAYMKATVKELAGLGQALKVCFKGSSGLKGVRKTALKEGISMKEALLKDPEVGTFYKAFFGRQGIIDPAVKWDDVEAALSNSKLAKVGSVIDGILKIPFNFLSGVDEVFKTVGTQMDYYSRVYGEGLEKGYRGADLDTFFKKAIKQGRPDFFNEALKVGREVTFQDDLGKMSKHMEQALNSNWFGLAVRSAFIPFYKITVNLVKYAAKNSPLGLGSKTVLKKLGGGGVDMYETIARISMGSAAMYWAWNAYEDGEITGRFPADMRGILRQADVVEYAHYDKKTREWVSMRRGDPFAMWFALSADLHMAMDVYDQYKDGDMDTEFQDVIAAFVMAAVEPTINATWMKGMKDFMDVVTDPERSKHKYKDLALKQVGSAIPATTLIDYINSEFGKDSYLREVHTLVDVLWKKLDSTKLLPKRDALYGEKKETENRWLHAVHKKTMTTDPATLEMVRIGADIQSPRDYLELDGVKLDLTPQKLDEFEEIYSKLPVKKVLNELVASPGYKAVKEDSTKAEMLKEIISEFRGAAKAKFMGKNPQITQQLIDKIISKAHAIAGLRESRDASAALLLWEKHTRE
jgi:hypothetical protein